MYGQHYSDDFNRADGALGSPWIPGTQAITISSNMASATSTAARSNLDLEALGYGPLQKDIALEVVIGAVPDPIDGSSQVGIMLGYNNKDGIRARWLGDGSIIIGTFNPISIITTVSAPVPQVGDTFKFQRRGPKFTAFVNGSPIVTIFVERQDLGKYAALTLSQATARDTALSSFSIVDTVEVVYSDTNTEAGKIPNNYLVCERSGDKVTVDEGLRTQWDGLSVAQEHFDSRHPQDLNRGIPREKPRGSPSPEPQDRFITTEVTVEDLG